MVDTISDILTRIRNANLIKSDIVVIPFTHVSQEISAILQNQGFIESFKVVPFALPIPSNAFVVSFSEEKEKEKEKTPLETEKATGFSISSGVLEKKNSRLKIILYLKYHGRDKKPCITNLKRISKPGLRIYTTYKEIPKILGGIGIAILSTSQGIMTDREARFRKIGGEVLCAIW